MRPILFLTPFATFTAFFLTTTISLAEQTYDQGPVFSFIEENDLVVNSDRHYTQGIKLAYLHSDGFLPFGTSNLNELLPAWGYEKKVAKFGYEIGQNIYTPSDLDVKNPLLNDRPYAGWLYAGVILQRRGVMFSKTPMLESFQLDFGVIGPTSLAEDAQEWVHRIRGFDQPRGWRNQLHDEPGIEFKYQRTARFAWSKLHPFDVEFLPDAGFSLGNIETTARVGGELRCGVNLPDGFGVQTIDSLTTASGGYSVSQTTSPWGFYFYGGSEGKAVLHNAFLDGNLFRSSASVKKEYLVGDLKAGLVFVLNRIELGYTFVFRTPEFHGQTASDSFGSLFLKAKF
ncbi:MAG: lipid A deacylase LpxR family protein [Verrucomicrobiota bacterium]